MRLELTEGDRTYAVEVETRDGEIDVTLDGKKVAARIETTEVENDYIAKVDGKSTLVHLEQETESSIVLTIDGETMEFIRPRASAATEEGPPTGPTQVEDGVLQSPMPGRIISVQARAGQDVKAGAPVIVMESMKMESVILSDRAGRIAQVLVKPGDVVRRGQVLLRFGRVGE